MGLRGIIPDDVLVVCIMGQDCSRFLKMSLESVKNADILVYCDGGSSDDSIDIAKSYGAEIIENKYDQEDPKMNGKQRNFYLNYLKNKYPTYWSLCLDADEVVENMNNISKFIQKATHGLYSVHMRHFHEDLGHEDATVEKHFVPNRLFKISDADSYPEAEHTVLQPKDQNQLFPKTSKTDITCIWHLAHINHCFSMKKRYEKNKKHSNIHSDKFLEEWKDTHILGDYPNKKVDPQEIPDVILKNFYINKDRRYFKNRGIEVKHSLLVKEWYDYFQPKSVLDLGCGRGPFLYFWKWFVNHIRGIELSQWAVNNAFCGAIMQGDISEEKNYLRYDDGDNPIDWDLITAIDVLEHLDDNQLYSTLENMSYYGNKFLFSIPFKGDPNLEKDKTHKQFKTRDEWIEVIESFRIKIKSTPKHFNLNNQILVGEKK